MIKEQLQKIYEKNRIAGMSVAITDKDGIIFAESFGVANAEFPTLPLYNESLYRIASITKIISGMAIMKLAEDGLLDLDIAVNNYLPWLHFEDGGHEKEITLRHLLTHTSGLPAEYTPDGPREEAMLEYTVKEELPRVKFHHLPSEKLFLYSNWGIRLASYIAESVTKRSFTSLAKEYIIEPLGMDYTTFDIRVALTYPLSLPHREDAEGELRPLHYMKENSARMAAGGLYSNVIDLCKLARFILNGGRSDKGERILSEESVRAMCTPHARMKTGLYGITMFVMEYGDGYIYGHTGSADPYSTSLFVDPKSGHGVAFLMNTKRDELRLEVPKLIFDIFNSKEEI